MSSQASAYVTFARKSFQRALTYRAAFWTELVINLLFMVLYVFLWQALLRERPSVAGYDARQLLDYIVVAQTVMSVQFTLGLVRDLEAKIRSGAIIVDLMRPIDFQAATIATAAGPWLHVVLFNMLPKMAIFAAAGVLHRPASAGAAALFVISVALSFLVQVGLELIIGVCAFWLFEVRALQAFVFWGIGALASGYFAPLELYPGWLAAVAQALPFRAIVQIPSAIWIGRAGLGALAAQAGWAAALFVAGRLLLGVARRRLVVQGG